MKYLVIACTLIFFMGCEDVNVYAPPDNNESNSTNDCSSIVNNGLCDDYCAKINWQDLNTSDTSCLSTCNCKIPDSVLNCDEKDSFDFCNKLADSYGEEYYICSDNNNSKLTCKYTYCECKFNENNGTDQYLCRSCY